MTAATKTDSQDGELLISPKDRFVEAASEGLHIVLPPPRYLFVDIDSEEALNRHLVLMNMLKQGTVDFIPIVTIPSRTEGHCHVYVAADRPLTPLERITYQALMGSDVGRECLSHLRLELNRGYPTAFFEKSLDLVPDEVKAYTAQIRAAHPDDFPSPPCMS